MRPLVLAALLPLSAAAADRDTKAPPRIPAVPSVQAPMAPPALNVSNLPALAQLPQLTLPAAAAATAVHAQAAVAASQGPQAALDARRFDGGRELEVRSFVAADTRAEATGLLARLAKALSSASLDNTLRVLYDDSSRSHYYHGLSLATLEKAIDTGGLAPTATYVSDEAGYPYGYARSSARKTGTPGVVLQFEMAALDPLIQPGHYNPRAPSPGEKWEDVPHWFMANKTIPLSAQTPLSKKTVLEYLADQRDAHPHDASWDAKIAKFEAAFEMKARPAKPRVDDALADPLGLAGMTAKNGRWFKDGRPLTRLGKGTIGFVDLHPTRPGLIVKTISPSVDQLFTGLTLETAIEADDKAAKVLSDAGVGPKVLGTARVERRHVSVRERVLGKTMRELADERAFGPEEEALVLAMARKMAAKNVLVSDLKPENIMIGTTERDGERKAYFVDGGIVESFPEGLTEEQRFEKVLDYPNVIALRMDFNTRRMEESVRPLRFYLNEAREATDLPRWKLFLKRLGNAFLQGGMAAANR